MTESRSDPHESPSMLSQPVDAPEPLSAIRSAPDLNSLHELWVAAHEAVAPKPGRQKGSSPDGVEHALVHDRALIGALIRAADALAVRCDELAGRLGRVESLVEEVSNVLGAELTRLRASQMGGDHGAASSDPNARGENG
jgi:hypothetical protein